MQLRRNHIRFGKINHIFISHLHGDHVFGIYGLLSSLSLMNRKTPLNIYAPANYNDILHSHLRDFDINLSYEINFIALGRTQPELILDDKHLTVTSFPLIHRVPAFGFLFREKQPDLNIRKDAIEKFNIPGVRIPSIKKGADFVSADGSVIPNAELTHEAPEPLSYAYCSDTSFSELVPAFVKGVTVLYHEATFDSSLSTLARITGHSTATEAANVARLAGAGSLIIGHFSSRYRSTEQLVDEARLVFPDTYPAEDGRCYNIDGMNKPVKE
jgi:ribonuclease Z